jgi:hypothetical protein
MGETRGAYRALVEKPAGWRPLGRPRCMWIIVRWMFKKYCGEGCVDWIDLSQNMDKWQALVSAGMSLRVS